MQPPDYISRRPRGLSGNIGHLKGKLNAESLNILNSMWSYFHEHTVTRLIRSFNYRKRVFQVTSTFHILVLANELWSWILYYALPCLKDILPQIYWNHVSLLVEPMHIILSNYISKNDLNNARKYFRLFYKDFAVLYSKWCRFLMLLSKELG